MKLRIVYLDGTERDVTTSASARLLWEREHGPIIDAMLGRSDWATFLAFTTLSRAGEIDYGDILDWLDDVEVVQWGMPEDRLAALAVALGVIAPEGDAVEGDAVDPTDGASEAPSSTSS